MWNENNLTQMLKINYPIIQAGMAGGVTTPELVAAVSNAGGLGTLGAGYMSPEKMSQAIVEIKKQTTKPFAVNVFIPEYPEVTDEELLNANQSLRAFREELQLTTKPTLNQDDLLFERQMEVILNHEVPVCSFTFGVPSKERLHVLKEKKIITIGTATTVNEAVLNEESGVDMIVAQGSEAGGHRGTFHGAFEASMIGTMSLIPQVVDQVSIPVIAAGGIMDGRGIFASLVLGAQAAQLGTAFVTSLESGAKEQHKEAILNTTEDQTVMTSVFSGKPARGIQNQFSKKMKEHEGTLPGYPILNALTQDIRKEAAKRNRPELMSLWCGQNPRLSQKQSATEWMVETIAQIERVSNG
ncbi:NAD(P)H-dependent flavin oxidoreductase [Aureibacillus halotolerans]|uniref:Probable nitronate monooxygenase n=1 Tax=Aureibacillus halotolerans TaxID=1508390 RepID=A0A4R6UCR1_9BACI|nr:nitronate monooxygenase [Aureibacillus halotolerans]TDQ42829.1 nitronate monooxygenase [Aureibacillus halotolerans]